MKIGITGASGFIGAHVAKLARKQGHEVVGFSRKPAPAPGFAETRRFSQDEKPDLSGLDAIVHLAGESIMGLWTTAKKNRILTSRVEGTRRIVEALNSSPNGPSTFICGSAIGYYGDTGEQEVAEPDSPGEGFLAGVCDAWERAGSEATRTRTVFIRTGFVLGSDGGAMKLIAPVFRAGIGGRLGDGRQWMSCIHVDDVAGIILHAIGNPQVSGPLNAVMPDPARNVDFTRAIAHAAHRPAIFPAPAFAIRIALGELSHLLLDSQRVLPKATLASGYAYRFPTLDAAAADVFAKR
jgi:uncharacterized protein (TIGR01777 family)